MRSIGKYDLLEAIAGGDVEVFLAEEIRTRLRRLVCIIRWKDDPKPPSTRDILQAFRQLAPDPPGVIIDSGQDAASRSVYLVTSYPSDPLAIETWVKAYEVVAEKRRGDASKGSDDVTQGFVSEPPAKAAAFSPRQPKREPAPPPVAEKPVGEFTRMFHDSAPKPVPVADERSPLVPDLSPNQPRHNGDHSPVNSLLRHLPRLIPIPSETRVPKRGSSPSSFAADSIQRHRSRQSSQIAFLRHPLASVRESSLGCSTPHRSPRRSPKGLSRVSSRFSTVVLCRKKALH